MNKNLHKAKRKKNDEFYTLLKDIEAELKHYEPHFKDKVVYCNCDDKHSMFLKYFMDNFKRLGIKKLLNCHLRSNGTGGFESKESIKLLKEADIVVTNPPFSLFRPYVKQLMDHNKKFLIIGNLNAVTYKEIFPLLKDDKVWIGNTFPKEFIEPNGNATPTNSAWVTNIIPPIRPEIPLTKTYDPLKYPKYDNYDAINVDKVKDIPKDYDGVMGVPITFLRKYSPPQFEFVGIGNGKANFTPSKEYTNTKKVNKKGEVTTGGAINCVLALGSNTKPPLGVVYYTSKEVSFLLAPFARILIKKTPQFEIIKFRKGDDDKDLTVKGKTPYLRVLIKRAPQFEILGIANNARWIGLECITKIQKKSIYNRVLIRRTK